MLEHNIGLGIRRTKLDGIEIFRGVRLMSDDAETLPPEADDLEF
jgi:hypothetical protein